MSKLLILLTVSLAAYASTIDSGSVFTRPYNVSDASTVQLANLRSSDGHFWLFGEVLGGANLDCDNAFLGLGYCPFGTYSLRAFFPDASSYQALANLVTDGGVFVPVVIGCPNPFECPQTSVILTADAVNISAPGSYVVPFVATGQIQASEAMSEPLILNQQVSGVGSLYFTVSEGPEGNFHVNGASGTEFRWQFQSVPEPSMIVPTLLGLVAIQWRRRTHRKRS